jgi:hypothetical protein
LPEVSSIRTKSGTEADTDFWKQWKKQSTKVEELDVNAGVSLEDRKNDDERQAEEIVAEEPDDEW